MSTSELDPVPTETPDFPFRKIGDPELPPAHNIDLKASLRRVASEPGFCSEGFICRVFAITLLELLARTEKKP